MPWTKLQADASSGKWYPSSEKDIRILTYREALKEAQLQALQTDPDVFIMGEGVDDPGGIFGTTKDLHKRFGNDRVFDLPLSENGFTGIAVGAAIAGARPILVHMRMDFLLLAADQIINHAAKWRYMFGSAQHVPLTIRAIIGRGWGSGAQHSQSLQGTFLNTPGLKIVMPSNAYDAKGLLLASIADPDPVLFIEHRWLYDHKDRVPAEVYTIPIGKADIKRKGRDVTIVATSYMVWESIQAAEQLYSDDGIDVEIVDLRSINPMDESLVFDSVKKTGRLIIADTGCKKGGISGEIAAEISEKLFSDLKAPVKRIALPDTPTPASHVLEEAYYSGQKEICEAVKETMRDRRIIDRPMGHQLKRGMAVL